MLQQAQLETAEITAALHQEIADAKAEAVRVRTQAEDAAHAVRSTSKQDAQQTLQATEQLVKQMLVETTAEAALLKESTDVHVSEQRAQGDDMLTAAEQEATSRLAAAETAAAGIVHFAELRVRQLKVEAESHLAASHSQALAGSQLFKQRAMEAEHAAASTCAEAQAEADATITKANQEADAKLAAAEAVETNAVKMLADVESVASEQAKRRRILDEKEAEISARETDSAASLEAAERQRGDGQLARLELVEEQRLVASSHNKNLLRKQELQSSDATIKMRQNDLDRRQTDLDTECAMAAGQQEQLSAARRIHAAQDLACRERLAELEIRERSLATREQQLGQAQSSLDASQNRVDRTEAIVSQKLAGQAMQEGEMCVNAELLAAELRRATSERQQAEAMMAAAIESLTRAENTMQSSLKGRR